MFLTSADISDFNEEKLNIFVDKKIPEGLSLDYKEKLSGATKKEGYREFLKDVTAFANANGGNILIGVKEPDDILTTEQQIVGLSDGDALAKDLERLAGNSIDPRIPGLIVLPVSLLNGNTVVIINIPPSLGRPHMVTHDKHRAFYIRHTESSVPMSTHEIKESAIASLSAGARADNYMKSRQEDVVKYYIENTPTILMQAMPLIPVDPPWEINASIETILEGRDIRERGHALRCSIVRPTIEGIQGKGNSAHFDWFAEVHRNGYISAWILNKIESRREKKGYYLHSSICNVFTEFLQICSGITATTDTDLPYILRCKYLGAKGSIFIYSDFHGMEDWSEPYGKDTIIWPDQIRQIGDDFVRTADIWCAQLYNAFHLTFPE